MLLFNVASSKLWIKLLACRWQVTMLDLQVLSGNQSRHNCNQAVLSQVCSPNTLQWLQEKRLILLTMSVDAEIFCSYHVLLIHFSSISLWIINTTDQEHCLLLQVLKVHKHTVLLHYVMGYGFQRPDSATSRARQLKLLHVELLGWMALGCLFED